MTDMDFDEIDLEDDEDEWLPYVDDEPDVGYFGRMLDYAYDPGRPCG